MSEIRKIDVELESRVETGPVQFGDDWPGIFIRGDNAMWLRYALSCGDTYVQDAALNKLIKILGECYAGQGSGEVSS
jgi:hypothetical protein